VKFHIKSEKLEHKDQIIDLDFSELKVIGHDQIFDSLVFGMVFNSDKYEGKSSFVRYIGASRIDGFAIFEIDTFQLDRDNKILEILK
jgi:hypothetical protein